MSRTYGRSASFTSSLPNSYTVPRADGRESHLDFDFSLIISEMNATLQERDASLAHAEDSLVAMQQRLNESESDFKKLLDVNERMQLELTEKIRVLEHSQQQNALLQENLFELQNRTCALEDATMVKDCTLHELEMNLQLFEEESKALKRDRDETSSFIEQTVREQKSLSIEVKNTKRTSILVQQEAVKLDEELQKAHRQIKSLLFTNAQLELCVKKAEQLAERYKEEREIAKSEVSSLKLLVENKTFELMHVQREIVSLREVVSGKKNDGNSCGNSCRRIERIEYISDRERRYTDQSSYSEKLGRRISEVTSQNDDWLIKLTNSSNVSYESENDNLLVMLRKGGYNYESLSVISSVEKIESEKGGDEEVDLVDDIFDVGQVPEHKSKQQSVEAQKFLPKKPDVDVANRDMLVVYLYLTVASVKCQYSEIDLKTADLIQLGKDMPFWELYPFFVSVFESLAIKEKRDSNSSKIGRTGERRLNGSKLGRFFGRGNTGRRDSFDFIG